LHDSYWHWNESVNEHLALLIVIGAVGGLAGGLFGVGGSVVIIPALTETLGPNQHLYQAAAMIVNFFVAVPAALQHHRMGAIHRGVITRLLPLGLVSVFLGVCISASSPFAGRGEARLRGLFGLFLLFISLQEFRRLRRGGIAPPEIPDENAGFIRNAQTHGAATPPQVSWRSAAAIAFPSGFIAGLLGVGGGLLAVPLQRRWLRIPIHAAIANSATLIVATSLVGAAAKNYSLHADSASALASFRLAGVLAPPAILGSFLGSRWVHRISTRRVSFGFFALLLIAAIRLILGAFSL
jgi:hypothetical protein